MNMAAGSSCTIVEYFGGDDGYRCGYCKNEKGNFSHGMWSHAMTVQDYQDLIDRGWRRSGKYVYKPIMNKTCCPQYTIRCQALNFQPSKTHKKILKKMSKFLSKGEIPTEEGNGEPMVSLCEEGGLHGPAKVCHSEVESPVVTAIQTEGDSTPAEFETARKDPVSVPDGRGPETTPKPGVGADPGRPLCRKAKDLRKARRLQKEQKRQVGGGVPVSATSNPASPVQLSQPKALEEFINESLPDSPLHRLEVRLVPVNDDDPQFMATYEQSAALYARYQMAVHGDTPSECNESEFRRFLCDSPLEAETSPDGPAVGYGSFHQQYWLDGRIVAVGVVDILPTCVSSVYLYYHPDFASLSLGSYSALREVAFTRQLQKQSPKLCYYYLGFYIHSCNKMRYKGQYQPSELLCPETYVFVPIERCIPSLEQTRYARFNQDPDAGDTHVLKDLGRALVLYRRKVMPYAAYARKRKGSNDEMEVAQYAGLVGQVCAERILLYRA
ncbi:arginyl-tRNA--protein transferase 1-like [Coregonus clupeaformis]|uniref:arginyl-tRNA--protein transferase 1-like n=1 Tax=Coregonus clupeaformis TaxID=59861 RepID=UPI001BDFEE1D|nr:arginyl-tRNA--protein transferase 1-like [Coregonus clupeaformis]